eukprot:3289790-Amphidinium_carterae.1
MASDSAAAKMQSRNTGRETEHRLRICVEVISKSDNTRTLQGNSILRTQMVWEQLKTTCMLVWSGLWTPPPLANLGVHRSTENACLRQSCFVSGVFAIAASSRLAFSNMEIDGGPPRSSKRGTPQWVKRLQRNMPVRTRCPSVSDHPTTFH